MSEERRHPSGPEGYPFKVNGVRLHSTRPSLPASVILILAAENDAIPGNPDQYFLEDDDGTEPYQPSDVIDLRQHYRFIASPNTATPVASKISCPPHTPLKFHT